MRATLTVAGATLGVALLTGVLLTNDSTAESLDRSFGGAGSYTVNVSADGGTLPEGFVSRVAQLDGVAAVSATAVTTVRAPKLRVTRGPRDQGPADEVTVYATTVERGRAPFTKARAALANQHKVGKDRTEGRSPVEGADELALGRQTASVSGIRLGDTVEIRSADAARTLKVVGIYGPAATTGAYAPFTVVHALGGPAGARYGYIELGAGVDPEAWVAAHGADFGRGVTFQSTAATEQRVRAQIKPAQDAFAATAGASLFVGAFLVYLTMSTSVEERAQTYGVLRAIGTRRGQVVRLVFAEASVVGVIAAVLGLGLGAILARGLVALTAKAYGLRSGGVAVGLATLTIPSAVGVATCLLAAAAPAFRAARVDPAISVRAVPLEVPVARRRWAPIAGLVLLVVGLSLLARGVRDPDPAPSLTLLGAIAIVPNLLGPVAGVVGRVTRRLSPGVGDAAVMHLVRERNRSASTASLVMVVLTMVVATAATFSSYRTGIDEALSRAGGAEIGAYSATELTPEALGRVRSADGVARIAELRTGSTSVSPLGSVEYLAVNASQYFATDRLSWASGTERAVRAGLDAGDSVALPLSLLAHLGAHVGGDITLQGGAGPVVRRVVGVYEDLKGPAILMSADDADRLFGPGHIDALAIRVLPHADPEHVAQAVRAALHNPPGLYVATLEANRAMAKRRITDSFNAFFAVVGVAVVVGVLGLASTLATSVLKRTREIGVLRALGIQRREVAAMVAVEALTIAAIAGIVATPLGLVITAAVLRGTSANVPVKVGLHVPWQLAPLLLITAVAVGGLATLAPARTAARLEPIDALRAE